MFICLFIYSFVYLFICFFLTDSSRFVIKTRFNKQSQKLSVVNVMGLLQNVFILHSIVHIFPFVIAGGPDRPFCKSIALF